MENVDYFSNLLKVEFDILVNTNQVSYESNELYRDEVDESLIPASDLKRLSNPILFETLLYIDEEDNEWIAGIVVNKHNMSQRKYVVCIKNGELILNRFIEN